METYLDFFFRLEFRYYIYIVLRRKKKNEEIR